jgi:hypothetical protein
MTMKAVTSPTLLTAPLIAQEKGAQDVSYVALPEQEDTQFQTGGPLWCGIWCFLMHVVMGVFMSSFSYIPYAGESPALLRSIFLVAVTFAGVLDHTYVTSKPEKLDNVWKATVLPSLLGLFCFLAKLYTVLPVGESIALVFLLLVLLAGPGVMYKNATGKEAPTVHSELMESLTSGAGVATHAGADTAFAIYYIFCWKLMGFPLLMGWLQ